ncbi:MAG TPA: GDP-mannose 4,6-dehydratase [Nitrososphaerales archaeon]|jgi:dTDP-glucose 4,6-dehydratase|nr:GDP-mannose 4,6-dehydratase [Nitrososphaerales archaeon]|tara:strand:- start:188 stop:1189 length:1002 start_codon:yes stop_codon:yes gene_type:complete
MKISSKNILVTGGAGFIGSSLVRELLKEKANVIVYDNFLSGDKSNLTEVSTSIKIIEGDIIDPLFVDVLQENEIDLVFNLAAEPYIPHCYERPQNFLETNALGTLNVLMACKKADVQRIIQYSTSEVYGTAKYVPIDENHLTNPLSTYAVTKLAADRLCYTLHHEHGIPVIILRQFNTYGPRETQPYVIAEIISQLSKGNHLKLGNIKARRDLTYVDDAAKGSILLMKSVNTEGEVFNLGSGIDHSIEEIAHILGKIMGYDSINITIDKDRLRPLDVQRLQCNYFKAFKSVGYGPTVSLKDGLKLTVDWFNLNSKKWVWENKIISEEKMWKIK